MLLGQRMASRRRRGEESGQNCIEVLVNLYVYRECSIDGEVLKEEVRLCLTSTV